MDGYTQGHVERNTMTFYFVYPKPSIFVPDTEKCLIYLRYEIKNFLKNKEKTLDEQSRKLNIKLSRGGLCSGNKQGGG